MIELIDQSLSPDADPQQPAAFSYRCDKCGTTFRALTRARAEAHKCGVPITVQTNAADTAALRKQVEDLTALVAKLTRGAENAKQATTGVGPNTIDVELEPEREIVPRPKRRGRPRKKAVEVTEA